MSKKEYLELLDEKVSGTIYLIDVLYDRRDVTKSLLDEFKTVLLEYQKTKNFDILDKLKEIDYRPVKEGADTDFTTGISVRLDGEQHVSLQDLLLEIEDLVIAMRKEA